jgi:hypothetical protein
LEAVKNNGDALKFASERFKNDRNIILEAIKQSPFELPFDF